MDILNCISLPLTMSKMHGLIMLRLTLRFLEKITFTPIKNSHYSKQQGWPRSWSRSFAKRMIPDYWCCRKFNLDSPSHNHPLCCMNCPCSEYCCGAEMNEYFSGCTKGQQLLIRDRIAGRMRVEESTWYGMSSLAVHLNILPARND